MQLPVQVVFEHIKPVDYIDARVREEAKKLEQVDDRITSARVVIGRPQHRHHKGDIYTVRLHLTIPGAPDISISRDPAATGRHEDVQVFLMPLLPRAGSCRISCAKGKGRSKRMRNRLMEL